MTDVVSQKKLVYAIQLINKFSGDYVWLGSKHQTREAAKCFAEGNICLRCNRYEIYSVDPESTWIDRKEGFGRR
jgi:hypothetical protein